MTEIQLPLHQTHQKGGMNGKFLPKNSLEIRGGGVGNSIGSNTNDLSKSQNSKKQSLKLIKLNTNTEKLDQLGTIVSVNLISSTARNSNFNSNNDANLAQSMIHKLAYQNSHHWHDESNSGWTSTGVMSDRSSVYSIDDCDFDREASKKVGSQLKAIESVLYEQTSTDSTYLNECKEWLEKFTHLRILGTQIGKEDQLENTRLSIQSLPSTYRNSFVNKIETSNQNESNNNNNNNNINNNNNNQVLKKRENTDLNNQGLYLNGFSLPIRRLNELDLNNDDEFSFLKEEIIEEEGVYEELLAYDNQEEEYLFEHNKRLNLNKRRKHGLPPITPKAAMKDLVNNFLFDHMWSELIIWSSTLIKEYSKTVTDKELYYQQDINEVKTPRLQQINQDKIPNQTESFVQLNNILNQNNNNTNTNFLSTKPSVVQLKQFDINSLFTPGLSRDNSTLYNQNFSKNNENILENKFGYSESVSTVGELIPHSNFEDLLIISKLNKQGLSNNNKNLTPINRIGSGNRKHQIINNYYKKKYSISSEISTNPLLLDKNMSIHGASILNGKPNNLLNESITGATANSANNRSNNNSSQAYHLQSNLADEHNSSYDNDYLDYNYNQFGNNNNEINENSIDEINLINSSNFSKNYGYNSNLIHYNNKTNNSQLPPISNSLTLKPLRISSANNSKVIKEKNERPLTSTATRHENFLLNKRSTTPSSQLSVNKALTNLYPFNMKVTGTRLSSDENFYSNPQPNQNNPLSNYISTKSFASLNSNYNSLNQIQQTNNRRNSIKEYQRIHK